MSIVIVDNDAGPAPTSSGGGGHRESLQGLYDLVKPQPRLRDTATAAGILYIVDSGTTSGSPSFAAMIDPKLELEPDSLISAAVVQREKCAT